MEEGYFEGQSEMPRELAEVPYQPEHHELGRRLSAGLTRCFDGFIEEHPEATRAVIYTSIIGSAITVLADAIILLVADFVPRRTSQESIAVS